MTELTVPAHIARIKIKKPTEPTQDNCLDFELGDSGFGVRVITTWDPKLSYWLVSTSIGRLTLTTAGPNDYTPMDLRDWTAPLRESATSCVNEVLDCFEIDERSKHVTQGQRVVMFKFRERA